MAPLIPVYIGIGAAARLAKPTNGGAETDKPAGPGRPPGAYPLDLKAA